MVIGDRLRDLRILKNLSQMDIEKRTGLLCSYISRVENGHTVPSIQTLEKIVKALEIPMYQLFYNGDEAPILHNTLSPLNQDHIEDWASRGRGKLMWTKITQLLSRMSESDRLLLLSITNTVITRKRFTSK
jgi:transcriptional regulator with XRE-family HTH domain